MATYEELRATYGAGAASAPSAQGGARSYDELKSLYGDAPPGKSAPAEETLDEPAQPEKPGYVESALRGAKQGLTFGFGDEITGALESAFSDKTYKQARDEARANDKAASSANPLTFGIGEILGGVAVPIPGVGALAGAAKGAALGTRLAVNAAKGAGAGIFSGIGGSESDSVAGVAKDAATSGLAGAALGGILGTGIERYVHGAEGRAGKQVIQEITGGRATAAGKDIYRNEQIVLDAAKKFHINADAARPEVAVNAAKAAQKEVGSAIGESYEALDSEHSGAMLKDVVEAAKELRAKYNSPSDKPLRTKIDSYAADLMEQWADKSKPGRSRVPLADLNREVGKLEKMGFAGADVSPVAAKQLKRDMADALDGVLEKRMAEIDKSSRNIARSPMGAHPALEGATGASAVLKELPVLNRDYRGLKLIARAGEDRAGLPDTNRAAGGLRDIAGKGVKAMSIAASLASGNPLPVLATHVAAPLAKMANKGATAALARLSLAARTGSVTASAVQEALAAGVPKSLIARMAPFAASMFRDAPAEETTEL